MFSEIRYLKYQSSDIMVIGEPAALKSFHHIFAAADETEDKYIWLLTLSSISPEYYSPGCPEDWTKLRHQQIIMIWRKTFWYLQGLHLRPPDGQIIVENPLSAQISLHLSNKLDPRLVSCDAPGTSGSFNNFQWLRGRKGRHSHITCPWHVKS